MASRPIDEKIVAMKMDNSDFKQKAVETTGLFGKLRDSLNKIPGVNLGKTTKDLNNIQNAANHTRLDGLAKSVDTIASRFSTLGVVATTAIANISNKVVDLGLKMARSTIEPMKDGFNEYETKMKSIQTILANTQSKGTTLKDVKESLNELNTYADKTIYSFSDMTRNIGLFTNAGLGLKESTSMIKGFSNAAAASGTNAEQAANAAYQLSQGLSSGYLMQMDWMSLTNAGMGNDNMKRDLISIGQAMGTLSKRTDNAGLVMKNWKESLSKGKWLTKDVMSIYLQAMAGDMNEAALMAKGLTKAQADLLIQNAKTGNEAATYVRTFTQLFGALKESIGSGWATSWELIIGDFDVATKRLTALSNVLGAFFQKQAKDRNAFIKELADKGVFDTMFDGVTTALTNISKVFMAISDGIKKAFPPMSVDVIASLVKWFTKFAVSLIPSEKTLKNISTIFQAVFSVIKTGINIIVSLGKALIHMIPPNLVTNIISFLAYLSKMVLAFTDSINSGNKAHRTFNGLTGVFAAIGYAISGTVKMVTKLGDTIAEVWNILAKGDVADKGPWSKDSNIVNWLLKVRENSKEIVKYLSSINVSFTPVVNGFNNFFKSISDGYDYIKEKVSGFGNAIKKYMPNGNQLLAGGFVAALATIAWKSFKFANDFIKAFKDWAEIGGGIKEVLESTSNALNSFALSIKANALLTIAIAVGVLAGSLLLLSRLNGQQIATGLEAILGSITALVGALAVIDKYDISGGMKPALAIVGLSIAFAIMAGSLKKVAELSWGDISKGITGLVGVMGSLALAMAIMSKFGGAKIGATSLQIVAIAISINLLLDAIKEIAKIDTGVLVKGVFTMGVILAEMGLFMKLVGGSKFGIGSTLGMLAIGKAIINITDAIDQISKIDVNNLRTGLVTIAAILAEVAIFAKLTTDSGLFTAGAGLLLVSAAITALIVPIAILGNMDLQTLAVGLGAMTIALLAIGVASKLMTGLVAAGAGLILVAAGLTLLLIPMEGFAHMSWEGIAKGIVGVALSLLVIGGTSLLLSEAIPFVAAFGIALIALGAGMALAGAAFALFGTGLVTLSTLTAGAVTSIVAVIGTLLVGIASLIPTAVKFVIQLIVQIVNAVAQHAPGIVKRIAETILQILTTLGQYAPKLFSKMAEILLSLLDVIIKYLPQFIKKGTKLILDFLDGLGQAVPELIDGAIKFMIKLVDGMAKGIRDNGPKLISAVLELVGEIINLVIEAGVQTITALFGWIPGVKDATTKIGKSAEKTIRDTFGAYNAGKDKGKDFADALGSKSEDVKSAGKKVGKAGEDGTDSVDLMTIGKNKGTDFAKGLGNKSDLSNVLGKKIANAGKDGAGSVSLFKTGSHMGDGFSLGIGSTLKNVAKAAGNLAKAAYDKIRDFLDIHSPSKATQDLGYYAGEGLAKGISSTKKRVTNSAKSVASSAKKGFEEGLQNINYRIDAKKIGVDEAIKELEKLKAKYKEVPNAVARVNKEMYDITVKHSKDSLKFIKDEAAAHKISTSTELSLLQQLANKYKKNSSERLQIEKEIVKVKDKLEKETTAKLQAQLEARFNKEKSYVEDRKKHNKLALTDELNLYLKYQKEYKVGSEQRKYWDEQVYNVKKEIYDKLKDANDNYAQKVKDTNQKLKDDEVQAEQNYKDKVKSINDKLNDDLTSAKEDYEGKVKDVNDKLIEDEQRLTDAYQQEIDNRTKSLYDFAGLFDEVTRKDISGQSLIDNLDGQVSAFEDYQSNLDSLSSKGISEGLLKELKDAGPKSVDEIKALNSLSTDQLTKYVSLWEQKSTLAHDQAIKETEGLRIDTENQIEQLKTKTNEQLDQLNADYVSKIAKINSDAQELLEQAKTDWVNTVAEMRKKANAEVEQYGKDLIVQITDIVNGTKGQFDVASASMKDIGKNLMTGIMSGLTEMTGPLLDQAKDIANSISGTINKELNIAPDTKTAGKNAATGLNNGIAIMNTPIVKTVSNIANSVVGTVKSVLKIHSPSRVMMGLGNYVGEGLVIGIANTAKKVGDSARDLATTAKDSINNFLNGIDLTPEDNEIHFKAVVDYSKLDPSKFDTRGLNITPDTSFAIGNIVATRAVNSQNGSNNIPTNNSSVETKSTVINQNLTFNSQQLTPSEVARKNLQASRQLAMQWG